MKLSDALWNYWISRQTPPGINLGILAAALEFIIDGWYKHSKSKSQGRYMKTKDFELLIRNEIESINKKLATFPHRQEIIDKILNANAFGITEKFKIFFDEIKLPIGEDELQAISERHKFVHGRMKLCDADRQKVILHGQVLETLLNKVLLKILGYKGSYIDRSIIGWPDKNLSCHCRLWIRSMHTQIFARVSDSPPAPIYLPQPTTTKNFSHTS